MSRYPLVHIHGARRFALLEIALWVPLDPAYLVIRGTTIGKPDAAIAHATRLVKERTVGLFHATYRRRLASVSR